LYQKLSLLRSVGALIERSGKESAAERVVLSDGITIPVGGNPQMRRHAALLGPLALAAIIAGCGSSSSSSSAGGSGAAASTPASPASSSGGAYGSAGGANGAAASSTSSAPAPKAAAVTLGTKHLKVGTILAAGPRDMTVYLFEADRAGVSNCGRACATVWPPVTGSASVTGAAISADVGTIKRSDGSSQVTYKGHPLYYFARDGDHGDAYGQGIKSFGAGWYVLAPTGSKIDKS
jgi:predicted lipoprotein with Yx(FWY)xxD motif